MFAYVPAHMATVSVHCGGSADARGGRGWRAPRTGAPGHDQHNALDLHNVDTKPKQNRKRSGNGNKTDGGFAARLQLPVPQKLQRVLSACLLLPDFVRVGSACLVSLCELELEATPERNLLAPISVQLSLQCRR